MTFRTNLRPIKPLLIAALILFSGRAFSQSVEEDPAAIIELGATPSQGLTGGKGSFGPDFAVEFTPIENWLEIEAGVAPLFSRGSTEWDTDVLLKKPLTLSERVEFMAGLGPEWIHTSEHGRRKDSAGVEVAGDFMFWPSRTHKFGWFLEPAYDYSFGPGHEQSISVSVGLLIGIGKEKREKAARGR